jgi:hypothetical protein
MHTQIGKKQIQEDDKSVGRAGAGVTSICPSDTFPLTVEGRAIGFFYLDNWSVLHAQPAELVSQLSR